MTNTLILMVGLPRSGKSTLAQAYAHMHPGVVIINPDAFRLAIHGQAFIKEAEGFVWATITAAVKAAFLSGHHTVILDATNITEKRRAAWDDYGWDVKFCFVDTDAFECIRRAKTELIPVIQRMAADFEGFTENEDARVIDLRSAIVVQSEVNQYPASIAKQLVAKIEAECKPNMQPLDELYRLPLKTAISVTYYLREYLNDDYAIRCVMGVLERNTE